MIRLSVSSRLLIQLHVTFYAFINANDFGINESSLESSEFYRE